MEKRNLKNKNQENEKVVLFGEEITGKENKNEDNVVFGVLLLLSGVIFLFNSLGLLTWDVWQELWRFWPVVLILGGLQIILGKNSFSRFVLLLVSILVFGSVIVFVLKSFNQEILKYIPVKFVEWSDYWEVIGK